MTKTAADFKDRKSAYVLRLHRIGREALALLIVLFGISVHADAQALIWRNDWTVQSPPSFQYFFSGPYLAYQQQAPFVFSDDGELLMRAPTLVGQDDQIVRFTSSGTVRWRANIGSLGSSEEPTYSSMLANTDGSAFVAQYLLNLVKIDADGTIKWAATTDAYLLAPLTDQAVAVLGCNSLSALNAQTGQLLWKQVFSNRVGTCAASGLVSDAVGNTYVTLSTFAQANSPISGFQLLKFDITGHVLWLQNVAAASAMRPFGVSGARVYVTPANFSSTDPVRAFAVSDGSLTWTTPGTHGLCLAGIPAEAIVSGASGVQRLDDADGQPRWSQPSASGMFASANGNKILVGASAIDANTGAIFWTAALPTADQYGNFLQYLTSGTMSDGSIIFAGSTYVQPPGPVLQRVDPVSGQLLNPIAVLPSTQSFLANSILADTLTIADAVTVDTSTGPETHVRALETTDGNLRWETVEQLGVYADVPSSTGIVRAGSAIAVSVAKRNALWVGVFDQATGNKRWSTVLYTYLPSQDQGRITAYDPIADPAGNVIISYGAIVGCPPPAFSGNCTQLSIVKLNAADGSIAWQHDDVLPFPASQVFPQSIYILGSDILVAGKFTGQYVSSSLLKFSGSDGSVAWASNIFYVPNTANSTIAGIYLIYDGNIVVTGNGWAKVDANTGATLWSNPPSSTCISLCYTSNVAVLPDGSLLSTGEASHKVWIALLPASAGAAVINWHPDEDDKNVTRSFADFPFRDSAGALWMRVGRRYGSSDTIFYLSKFDLTTGTFTTQQSLLVYSNDPLLPWVSPLMLAAPENNRFPAFTYINNPPEPFLIGDALVNSTISANGNLSMQITTDHTYVQPGQLLGFHLTAKYSGDAPISGAKLVADFPWAGFATGLTCVTQSASNCQFDNRASTVVASFDVQPGGQIDVTGNIRVTSTSGLPKLRALVAGPINLNELNSTDNAVAAIVDQSMFANGFE